MNSSQSHTFQSIGRRFNETFRFGSKIQFNFMHSSSMEGTKLRHTFSDNFQCKWIKECVVPECGTLWWIPSDLIILEHNHLRTIDGKCLLNERQFDWNYSYRPAIACGSVCSILNIFIVYDQNAVEKKRRSLHNKLLHWQATWSTSCNTHLTRQKCREILSLYFMKLESLQVIYKSPGLKCGKAAQNAKRKNRK